MAQVKASNRAYLNAAPSKVAEFLEDYQQRPSIQPENYSAFRVIEGGTGEGTVVAWNLRATKKRNRDVEAEVSVSGDPAQRWKLIEDDRNSSMVTTYTVTPEGAGTELVVTTVWQGAGGIGGFFERLFAPKGLESIQQAQIDQLNEKLSA